MVNLGAARGAGLPLYATSFLDQWSKMSEEPKKTEEDRRRSKKIEEGHRRHYAEIMRNLYEPILEPTFTVWMLGNIRKYCLNLCANCAGSFWTSPMPSISALYQSTPCIAQLRISCIALSISRSLASFFAFLSFGRGDACTSISWDLNRFAMQYFSTSTSVACLLCSFLLHFLQFLCCLAGSAAARVTWSAVSTNNCPKPKKRMVQRLFGLLVFLLLLLVLFHFGILLKPATQLASASFNLTQTVKRVLLPRNDLLFDFFLHLRRAAGLDLPSLHQ